MVRRTVEKQELALMNKDKMHQKNTPLLRVIIAEVLKQSLSDRDELVSMLDIPEWDSLAHVQIIVAIEKRFSVEANIALVEAQSLFALTRALEELQDR
jgi:acyl carrier protein